MTRIVVTGLGLITSLGSCVSTNWRSMVEGKDGGSEIPYFDTSAYRVHRAHVVREALPELLQPPNTTPADLALAAAREAITDSGLALGELAPERVGLSLGTLGGELRIFEKNLRSRPERKENGYSKEFAFASPVSRVPSLVAERLGIGGSVIASINACCSGNQAIATACDWIEEGGADAMIAIGVDSVTQTGFTYFHNLRALAPEHVQPFDKNRRGLMLGEGAAVMVLEPYHLAAKRGARICAEILGYGLSSDGFHVTAPHPEARGAIAAMRRSLAAARVSPNDIDYINAHGTATPANDLAEALALRAVFGDRASRVAVSSTKSMVGHTMGASSAIESVVCCLAVRDQVAPPTINFETPDPAINLDVVPNAGREMKIERVLNNSFAFGGNNASIVFGRV